MIELRPRRTTPLWRPIVVAAVLVAGCDDADSTASDPSTATTDTADTADAPVATEVSVTRPARTGPPPPPDLDGRATIEFTIEPAGSGSYRVETVMVNNQSTGGARDNFFGVLQVWSGAGWTDIALLPWRGTKQVLGCDPDELDECATNQDDPAPVPPGSTGTLRVYIVDDLEPGTYRITDLVDEMTAVSSYVIVT